MSSAAERFTSMARSSFDQGESWSTAIASASLNRARYGLCSRRRIGDCPSSRGRDVDMLKEHDRVVLLTDVPDERLEAGDVGAIVHVYRDGKAYEVEFVALDGHTTAVATLETSQ